MTKAGTRLLINTSPEPFTNWSASLTGDFLVFSGMWAALKHPEIFLILLIVFIGIAIWLLPKLWRLIKVMFSKIGKFLGLVKAKPVTPDEPGTPLMQKHYHLSALERLQQLRDTGALTEQEFEQQKERILQESNH